jgi:eukaryotic translation initiation factor 2C
VVFFPTSDFNANRSGNCPAGMVIDTKVVSPVEFNYYLFGHAGLLGMSRPTHYNVLFDENKFM